MMKKRPSDHETAIQEVTRGYELTTQLQSLHQVQPLPGDSGSELAGVLLDGVLKALTASLSILKSGKGAADLRGGGSPEPDSACSSNNQGSEGSGERGRSSAAARNHHQDRRGRRKHLQSRTKVTSLPDFDGHQWRKYGQKNIHNSKYPRCYYRCTHRDGQSCPATKHVQQKDCQQDPPMFLVTYIEQHTCTPTAATPTAPQLILENSPPLTGPRVLSFGSSRISCGQFSLDERIIQNASYSERLVDVTQPSLPFNTLECSGELVSQQLVACSSSNHSASPATSVLGPMGADDPIFGVEIGDGDVFSYPSPGSQGWIMDYPIMDRDGYIMDYPIMDSVGCDLADVECFLS